jgi:hypothetical protein
MSDDLENSFVVLFSDTIMHASSLSHSSELRPNSHNHQTVFGRSNTTLSILPNMNPRRTHSCSHPSASRLTVQLVFKSRSLQDQQMMANDKSAVTPLNKQQLSSREKNKSVRIASSSKWNHGSESNAPMKPSRRNSVDDNPLWSFRCDNVHDYSRPTVRSILKSNSSLNTYDYVRRFDL